MSRFESGLWLFISDIDNEDIRNNIVAGISCYTHS